MGQLVCQLVITTVNLMSLKQKSEWTKSKKKTIKNLANLIIGGENSQKPRSFNFVYLKFDVILECHFPCFKMWKNLI